MAARDGFFTRLFQSRKPLPPASLDEGLSERAELEESVRKAQLGIASLVTAIHRVESGLSVDSIADADERERMQFRLDFLREERTRVLRDNGLVEADLLGREFTSALMVTATNAADFPAGATLWISAVLEPLIMSGDQTIREGRVTLSDLAPNTVEGTLS